MKPYFQTDRFTLHQGDCRIVLRDLSDCSVDSVVCDPPYELGFMNKGWDRSGIAYDVAVWSECLRVLKPGGHLLAFGGSRTYHRLACAIEDAGFQIRDQIMWLYGSGFPKSLDIAKAIDAMAGAERESAGKYRHPDTGKIHADFSTNSNRSAYSSFAMCEDARNITLPATEAAQQWNGWGTALKPAHEPVVLARKPLGKPSVNVVQAIEYNLKQNGFDGDIRWTQKPVSPAAKQSRRRTSTQTRPPISVEATSVEPASVNVTPDTESAIARPSGAKGENGSPHTQNEATNRNGNQQRNSEMRWSPHTAEGALAAENQTANSSHSIMSTATAASIENGLDRHTFIETCESADSRQDSGSCAGTATAQSGDTATVLTATFEGREYQILKSLDGSLVWPDVLPKFIPAQPLTVAENVLQHGTGGLNVDGCRIGVFNDGAARSNTPGSGRMKAGRSPINTFGRTNPTGPLDEYQGRWPANVIHDGSDEVLALFPETVSNGQVNPYDAKKQSSSIYGNYANEVRPPRPTNEGSAARFFKSCSYGEIEALFHRAKAIMFAWDYGLASTADNLSNLSGESAVSVLKRAVIAGSQGAKLLSDWTGLSMTVTPLELKRLGETLITAILSIERSASPVQPQERSIDNGCLVRIAATQRQIDTTTITISHWRSSGSADPVTLTLTPLNSEHGARDSSASRLIYCAKATQEDRNEGCEDLPLRVSDETHKRPRTELDDPRRAGVTPRRNNHPTVKPTDLMRYLCRLVTPPNGVVLDPFCGSGSTGKAAMLEGSKFIGIELQLEYCEMAQRRIEAVTKQGLLFQTA